MALTPPREKVSVSLDADLVEELEADDEALSRQVNEAIRDTLERRRRQRLLEEFLQALEDQHGPVPESSVQRYLDLLA